MTQIQAVINYVTEENGIFLKKEHIKYEIPAFRTKIPF